VSGNSREAGRSVVDRMAAILTAFTAGSSHRMIELAIYTGLAHSTVHRLLQVLVEYELLERTADRQYSAGAVLRKLQTRPCAPTFLNRGPHVVDDLAEALQTPARIGVLDDSEIIYFEKGSHAGRATSHRLPIGLLAVQTRALERALLAFVNRDAGQQGRCGSGTPATLGHTFTRVGPEATRLRRVRSQGFATSAGTSSRPDMSLVAVPVFDSRSTIATAALEVETPDLLPLTLARVLPCLTLAARRLSQEVETTRVPSRTQSLQPLVASAYPGRSRIP
jgi:DNA-binding IclR family transcriptional regulator